MFGTLHSKYIENTPRLLRTKNANEEADFIDKNMDELIAAVISPDTDYSELTFLHDFLPENLKKIIPKTSPIKFEHILVDDLPEATVDVFTKICDRIGAKYRYADVTLNDWYEAAKLSNKVGMKSDFLKHLGRCCHLVQDICVPMHCRLSANLRDIFDVFKLTDPNHKRFEAYCEKTYSIDGLDFNLDKPYEVPSSLQECAKKSREYIQMCDGIKFTTLWYKILKMLGILTDNEDYVKAAKYSNSTAQINTVIFLYYAVKGMK
jgi:hypothetical protein